VDHVQIPERRIDRLDSRIFLLAFAIFATGTDAGVVAGMLPQIAQDFHLSIGITGQLLTAYAITYAVGSPFFGVFASQYQSERIIIVCLISFALAVGLSAVAPGIAVVCWPLASPQPTRLPPSRWPLHSLARTAAVPA
jgi:predicted MFS family arabinose efflux permease